MKILQKYISWLAEIHGTEQEKKLYKLSIGIGLISIGLFFKFYPGTYEEFLFIKLISALILTGGIIGSFETYFVYKKLEKTEEGFIRVILIIVFCVFFEAFLYIMYLWEKAEQTKLEQLMRTVNG